MGFSLISQMRKDIAKSNEIASKEIQDNKRELYSSESMEVVNSSLYAGLNLSKGDILSYIQGEIVKISPMFSPIILENITNVNRDVIIFSNGKTISIGNKFYTENVEIVLLETLKVVIDISIGHYIIYKSKSPNEQYRILLNFAMRQAYSKITNTLLKVSPISLGIDPKKLRFTQQTIDKCLSSTTDKQTVYWEDVPNNLIQDAIEEELNRIFINNDFNQEHTIKIKVGRVPDSITINIPKDFINKYAKIQDKKKLIEELKKQDRQKQQSNENHDKDNDSKEDILDQIQKELSKFNEEKRQQDSQEFQQQESQNSQEQHGSNDNQSQESQQPSEQESQESQQPQQPSEVKGFGEEQVDSEMENESNSEPNSQQSTEVESEQNVENDLSFNDSFDEEIGQNDDNGTANGDQTPELFDDKFENFSQQDVQNLTAHLAQNMKPETIQEWNEKCQQNGATNSKMVMNELRDMCKYDKDIQNEVLDSIDQTQLDESIKETMRDKFTNFDKPSLNDMTTQELSKKIQEMANYMTPEEINQWNQNIAEKQLTGYDEMIEELMDSDIIDESTKEHLKDKLEQELQKQSQEYKEKIQEMLNNGEISEEDITREEERQQQQQSSDNYSDNQHPTEDGVGEQSKPLSETDLDRVLEEINQDAENQQSSESTDLSEGQDFDSQNFDSQDFNNQDYDSSQTENQGQNSYPEFEEHQNGETYTADQNPADYGNESQSLAEQLQNMTPEQLEEFKQQLSESMKQQLEQLQNMSPEDINKMLEDMENSLNIQENQQDDSEDNPNKEAIDNIENELGELLEDLGEEFSSEMEDIMNNMDFEQSLEDLQTLASKMNSIASMTPGSNQSSLLKCIIEEMYKVKVTWYKELEDMVTKFLPSKQPTFARPNKKYVHSGTILQSNTSIDRTNSIDKVDLYLDSSGSMSSKDLSILKSLLAKLSKKFPKDTSAYEFNWDVKPLKVKNGKLLEDPKSTGGTNIDAVIGNLTKRDSGRVLNIVVTDGGFYWDDLKDHMKKNKRDKFVIIVTQDRKEYREYKENNLGFPKKRFKVIIIEGDDLQEKNTGVTGW